MAAEYETCSKVDAWKKLLCALAFFHANIQERRKFGPLGWNNLYAFDESDLETSFAVLRRFLDEQDVIPWGALLYITGQINYGGRVTDDNDRKCLMAILGKYIQPATLEDGTTFSASGLYFAPPAGTFEEQLEYFDTLPVADKPEFFGMHENANTTFNVNASTAFMATVLDLQPREGGGGGGASPDEIVTALADKMEETLPIQLDNDEAGETTFVTAKRIAPVACHRAHARDGQVQPPAINDDAIA
jgi:dynein heavy chain